MLRFGFDEVAIMDELSPLVISKAGHGTGCQGRWRQSNGCGELAKFTDKKIARPSVESFESLGQLQDFDETLSLVPTPIVTVLHEPQ
jgi:hypothetical protein